MDLIWRSPNVVATSLLLISSSLGWVQVPGGPEAATVGGVADTVVRVLEPVDMITTTSEESRLMSGLRRRVARVDDLLTCSRAVSFRRQIASLFVSKASSRMHLSFHPEQFLPA